MVITTPTDREIHRSVRDVRDDVGDREAGEMRRPAQGGTSRPGPARPGSGYGRPVRSGPVLIGRDEPTTDPAWWFERELELELGRLEAMEPDHSAEPA